MSRILVVEITLKPNPESSYVTLVDFPTLGFLRRVSAFRTEEETTRVHFIMIMMERVFRRRH